MATLIALALAACSGPPPSAEPVVDPIPLPAVPVEYVSEILVIPPELQAELAGLLALPRIDWDTTDPTGFTGEKRRAAVYWRFSQSQAAGNGFVLDMFAPDRQAAERFAQRLRAGWGLTIYESYYTVGNRQAHYDFYRSGAPGFTLGESAWLAEWLLLNYPEVVADFHPHYLYAHSEGSGGSI